jgi:hypothetical protein
VSCGTVCELKLVQIIHQDSRDILIKFHFSSLQDPEIFKEFLKENSYFTAVDLVVYY